MWRKEDDVQRMLRESIESFVASEHSMARVRACRATEAGFDVEAWRRMAALGWAGILLGEDVGGSGLGLGPALTIAEGFGRYVIPEPFVATAVIGATILEAAPGSRARSLAANVATGETIVSLAWQEAINQTSFRPMSTRLHRKAGNYALDGAKIFVPAWTDKTQAIVSCILDDEVALTIVPSASATIKKMSDGGQTADLRFEARLVKDDEILLRGAAAADALELALTRGTIAVCAQLEGLALEVLSKTIDYMKQRVQFGQALSEFQALRHRIVDLHAEVELSGASWRTAAERLEEGGAASARVVASAAKARCSQTALDVSKAALQYHGAFGYTDDADIGLYLNSALRLSSWLGNPLAHRRNAFRLRAELANHA